MTDVVALPVTWLRLSHITCIRCRAEITSKTFESAVFLSRCYWYQLYCVCDATVFSPDETPWKQEEVRQQEIEDTLSSCSSLSHPCRPKHIDFLRLTAPEDDITPSPWWRPLEFRVSSVKILLSGFEIFPPFACGLSAQSNKVHDQTNTVLFFLSVVFWWHGVRFQVSTHSSNT